MSDIREILGRADFSKETDLKDRLRARLFGAGSQQKSSMSSKVVAFRALSDDDLTMVNAAQGIYDGMPKDDDPNKLF